MNTKDNIRIVDGLTVNHIPVKMLIGQDDRVRQVTLCAIHDLVAGRGLRVEEIVRIFRGNAFVGVSRKNLDGLVASWISVWKAHGKF